MHARVRDGCDEAGDRGEKQQYHARRNLGCHPPLICAVRSSRTEGGLSPRRHQPLMHFLRLSLTRRDNKFGMPGMHVKTLKDALLLLKKSDKGLIFQAPVPANFRGQKGLYSDIIENPMDLGTVLINVDEKYR